MIPIKRIIKKRTNLNSLFIIPNNNERSIRNKNICKITGNESYHSNIELIILANFESEGYNAIHFFVLF